MTCLFREALITESIFPLYQILAQGLLFRFFTLSRFFTLLTFGICENDKYYSRTVTVNTNALAFAHPDVLRTKPLIQSCYTAIKLLSVWAT